MIYIFEIYVPPNSSDGLVNEFRLIPKSENPKLVSQSITTIDGT